MAISRDRTASTTGSRWILRSTSWPSVVNSIPPSWDESRMPRRWRLVVRRCTTRRATAGSRTHRQHRYRDHASRAGTGHPIIRYCDDREVSRGRPARARPLRGRGIRHGDSGSRVRLASTPLCHRRRPADQPATGDIACRCESLWVSLSRKIGFCK